MCVHLAVGVVAVADACHHMSSTSRYVLARFGQTHGLGAKKIQKAANSKTQPLSDWQFHFIADEVKKRQSTLVQEGEPPPKKAEPEVRRHHAMREMRLYMIAGVGRLVVEVGGL